MNLLSWCLLLLVLLWTLVALRHVIRNKGGCSCGGKACSSGGKNACVGCSCKSGCGSCAKKK